MARRRRLFWKYVVFFSLLVTVALLASGLIEIYFSYQENKEALVGPPAGEGAGRSGPDRELHHRDRAPDGLGHPAPRGGGRRRSSSAASTSTASSVRCPPSPRSATSIATGREQVRVSRLAMDVFGSQADLSADPRFAEARARGLYLGPVYFRKESEPYMTIAIAEGSGRRRRHRGGGEPQVHLGRGVPDQDRQGRAGLRGGRAGRAHRASRTSAWCSRRRTSSGSTTSRPRSRAPGARRRARMPRRSRAISTDAAGADRSRHDPARSAGRSSSSSRWRRPSRRSRPRSGAPRCSSWSASSLSVIVSLILARRMVKPIRALQAGAAQFGDGRPGRPHRGAHRRRARRRWPSSSTAWRASSRSPTPASSSKVEERTRELTEALEQQTATAEILAGHQQLAHRPPAGDGRGGRERRPPLRRPERADLPARRGR